MIPPAAPTVMNEQKAAQLLAKPEEFQSQALAYGYVTEVPGKTVNLALAEQWADGSRPGELVYLSAGEKPAVYVFVRDDRPGYTICWYNAEGLRKQKMPVDHRRRTDTAVWSGAFRGRSGGIHLQNRQLIAGRERFCDGAVLFSNIPLKLQAGKRNKIGTKTEK